MSWLLQKLMLLVPSAQMVVYRGATGKAAAYKGERSDAQLYLGARQMWP